VTASRPYIKKSTPSKSRKTTPPHTRWRLAGSKADKLAIASLSYRCRRDILRQKINLIRSPMIRTSITTFRQTNCSSFKTDQMLLHSVAYYVGPSWPVSLRSYDYMLSMCGRDWSWEGLRHNPRYQDEARLQFMNGQVTTRIEGGALLTRMHEPSRAEAWALRSFR
jgi:hypothetical protein